MIALILCSYVTYLVRMYVCTTYVCMYVCIYIYIYIYICIYVCMNVCMYIFMYACLYIDSDTNVSCDNKFKEISHLARVASLGLCSILLTSAPAYPSSPSLRRQMVTRLENVYFPDTLHCHRHVMPTN